MKLLPVINVPAGTARAIAPARVEMDASLMLSVGQTLRTLAHTSRAPQEARDQYAEAGNLMVSAARAAIATDFASAVED